MSNQEIGIQLYFKDPLLVSQGEDLDFIITKVYFPNLRVSVAEILLTVKIPEFVLLIKIPLPLGRFRQFLFMLGFSSLSRKQCYN